MNFCAKPRGCSKLLVEADDLVEAEDLGRGIDMSEDKDEDE